MRLFPFIWYINFDDPSIQCHMAMIFATGPKWISNMAAASVSKAQKMQVFNVAISHWKLVLSENKLYSCVKQIFSYVSDTWKLISNRLIVLKSRNTFRWYLHWVRRGFQTYRNFWSPCQTFGLTGWHFLSDL